MGTQVRVFQDWLGTNQGSPSAALQILVRDQSWASYKLHSGHFFPLKEQTLSWLQLGAARERHKHRIEYLADRLTKENDELAYITSYRAVDEAFKIRRTKAVRNFFRGLLDLFIHTLFGKFFRIGNATKLENNVFTLDGYKFSKFPYI
ncbi:hypothetical protein ACFE04_004044 [Oxalis oulophora]